MSGLCTVRANGGVGNLTGLYSNVELPNHYWTKLYQDCLVSFLRLNDNYYDAVPHVICLVTVDPEYTVKVYRNGSWHVVDVVKEFGNFTTSDSARISRYLKHVEQNCTLRQEDKICVTMTREIDHFLKHINDSKELFKKPESVSTQLPVLRFCFEQVQLLNCREDVRKWSIRIIRLALIIYYRSALAYQMLRENGQILLPDQRTIEKYRLFTDAISDQEMLSRIKDAMSKTCMKERHVIVIVEKLVITEQENVMEKQVILLIYFQTLSQVHRDILGYSMLEVFNSKEVKGVLEKVIVALEQCGLKTEGIVMEGTDFNISVLKEFGLDASPFSSSASKAHPCDSSRKLSFLFDPLQAFERVRADWQEKEILTTNGRDRIDFSYIQKLYKYQKQSIYKEATILQCILQSKNTTQQEICQALTVFSKSVIQKLENCINECSEFNGAQETVEFLQCFSWLCFWLNINLSQNDIEAYWEHIKVYRSSKDFRLKALDIFLTWITNWKIEDTEHYFSINTLTVLVITLRGILDIMCRCLERNDIDFIDSRVFQMDLQ